MQGFDIRNPETNELEMTRLVVVKTRWFSVMVHRIYVPDFRPDPHDHPWTWFWSWIWSGGYTEEITSADGKTRLRTHKKGSQHVMRSSEAHRITKIHGVLWTFFVTGRDLGGYNYWTPEGKIPWQEYELTGTEGS